MDKRLFLAIALSLLFIMGYSSIVARYYHKPDSQIASQDASSTPSLVESPTINTPPQQEPIVNKIESPEDSLEVVQNESLTLSVDPKGSGISKCKLNVYDTIVPQAHMGLLTEWQAQDFKISDVTNGITMSYDDTAKGYAITKTYRFTDSQYILEMIVEFTSHSNTINYVKYNLNLGAISDEILRKNSIDQRYFEISISLPSKILRSNFLSFKPNVINEKIQWVGIRDRYMCSIIRPMQEAGKFIKSTSNGLTSYLLETPAFELLPGQTVKHTYLLYLGPQKYEYVSKLGQDASNIINFGFFDSLSHIFLGALKVFYRLTKNWGLAIILFSLAIFVLMSPLSIKSFKSMKRMQELQPIIEELKVKYKDNPQKMHKEVMDLYKEKKINPFGGCLPLVLQMPIFFALYQALMRFIDLKGAHFLWIKDLSEPDRIMVFSRSFPLIGNEFNLLPIIMMITMLVQQKLTTGKASQDPATGQQQKMMSWVMAILFGVMFYAMPAGLVLYWTLNSILMVLFQLKLFVSKK